MADCIARFGAFGMQMECLSCEQTRPIEGGFLDLPGFLIICEAFLREHSSCPESHGARRG